MPFDQLPAQLQAILRTLKGDWAVHYRGEGSPREATFMFETAKDRDAMKRWLP